MKTSSSSSPFIGKHVPRIGQLTDYDVRRGWLETTSKRLMSTTRSIPSNHYPPQPLCRAPQATGQMRSIEPAHMSPGIRGTVRSCTRCVPVAGTGKNAFHSSPASWACANFGTRPRDMNRSISTPSASLSFESRTTHLGLQPRSRDAGV